MIVVEEVENEEEEEEEQEVNEREREREKKEYVKGVVDCWSSEINRSSCALNLLLLLLNGTHLFALRGGGSEASVECVTQPLQLKVFSAPSLKRASDGYI